jgi:peptidoglycan/xylan/chitin deacetylase (PgdA/CDA1 family)
MAGKKIIAAADKLMNYRGYYTGNTPMVLLFHRVDNLSTDPYLLAVSQENFHAQVSFLKKEYNLLSTEEFAGCLTSRKRLPKKTILLTFDDGYADNLYKAIPILENLGAEALFFITTSLLGTDKEFWWDELERIFLLTKDLPPILRFVTGKQEHEFTTGSAEEARKTFNQLHPIIKYQHYETRDKLLAYFRKWAGIGDTGRATHRVMNWEEVKTFSQSKSAVIGAHTLHHSPLSIFNYQTQLEEIGQSKKLLEDKINKPVNYFSYPFGIKRDYNADSIAICRELGFSLSFSNFPGYVHKYTDLFQIPRILVRNWSVDELKVNLTKFQG